MIQTVRKAWAIPELKKKIVFTLLILLIFRIGNAITVPYIDVAQLEAQLQGMGATILGLYNVMSGGAFATATVFALSIQPYINSSIIIQLLTVAIPYLENLAKDGGEEGRKKIQSITRYTTVAIAILQAVGYYFMMKRYGILAPGPTASGPPWSSSCPSSLAPPSSCGWASRSRSSAWVTAFPSSSSRALSPGFPPWFPAWSRAWAGGPPSTAAP